MDIFNAYSQFFFFIVRNIGELTDRMCIIYQVYHLSGTHQILLRLLKTATFKGTAPNQKGYTDSVRAKESKLKGLIRT